MSILRVECSATRMHYGGGGFDCQHTPFRVLQPNATNLLDDVRAELLDRQRADVARELPDDSVAEAIVVQVEDVLDDLWGS